MTSSLSLSLSHTRRPGEDRVLKSNPYNSSCFLLPSYDKKLNILSKIQKYDDKNMFFIPKIIEKKVV